MRVCAKQGAAAVLAAERCLRGQIVKLSTIKQQCFQNTSGEVKMSKSTKEAGKRESGNAVGGGSSDDVSERTRANFERNKDLCKFVK